MNVLSLEPSLWCSSGASVTVGGAMVEAMMLSGRCRGCVIEERFEEPGTGAGAGYAMEEVVCGRDGMVARWGEKSPWLTSPPVECLPLARMPPRLGHTMETTLSDLVVRRRVTLTVELDEFPWRRWRAAGEALGGERETGGDKQPTSR